MYCEVGFPCDGDTELEEGLVTPTSRATSPECNPDDSYVGSIGEGAVQDVWAVPYEFY